MKKKICLLLSFLFIFNSIVTFATFNYDYEIIPTWSNSIEVMAQIQNKVQLNLDSEAAILMDEETGTILYTKNEHKQLRPASVTKVMTLLLAMEALENGDIKLDDKVPCSEKARKMGGSQIWLAENEKLTVNEMIKAICVVSANDYTVQFHDGIKCRYFKGFETYEFDKNINLYKNLIKI